jgi:hypothetical protein
MTATTPAAYSTLAISDVAPYVAPENGDFEPLILLDPEDSDDATITADSEASDDTPIELVQIKDPSQKYRSASTAVVIDLTFLSPVAANYLALVATNIVRGDTIRVQAFTDSGRTVVALDTGARNARPHSATAKQVVRTHSNRVRFDNDSAYLYWRITIHVISGQTYVEIGRLMLARGYQPRINPDFGGGFAFVPYDAQQFSDYGYESSEDHGLGLREGNFKFSYMDQSEAYEQMIGLRQRRGLHGDFFIDLQPYAQAGWELVAMQATFKGRAEFAWQAMFNGGEQMMAHGLVVQEVAE